MGQREKIKFFGRSMAEFSIVIYAFLDYIAVVIAESFAIFLRNMLMGDNALQIHELNIFIIIPGIYILFNYIKHLYDDVITIFYNILQNIIYASFYAIGITITLLYLEKNINEMSLLFILLFWIFSVLLLTFFRYIEKKFLNTKLFQESVLIIGGGQTASLFYKGIMSDTGMNIKVVGLLEDNEVMPDLKNIPVLGGFADATNVITQYGIKHVIIAAPGLSQKKLTKLILSIHPLVKKLSVIPNLVGIPMSNIGINSFYNEKIILVNLHNNLKKTINRIIKRILDIALSILGILILSPVLIILAACIYLDSAGPIIYSGKRLGINGCPFKCYKFRTMYTNGDEILNFYLDARPDEKKNYEVYHKINDDPRCTHVGKVLRKLSLDELPQLFNVLRGEMSLVGPRPYLLSEKKDMNEAQNIILMARPGITGLWQVSGRSDVTFDERLQMDVWYVRNWSVWIDIILLFKTVKVVVLKKGAC